MHKSNPATFLTWILFLTIALPGGIMLAEVKEGLTSKGTVYEVTAYCSCKKCCGKWADGVTASGVKAHWGVVATDWRVLPKGTRLKIEGFPKTTFRALDKGGAIKGKRIDIWFPSHKKALKFGRRKLRVTILSKEKRECSRKCSEDATLAVVRRPRSTS